jgi:hypothetical protein
MTFHEEFFQSCLPVCGTVWQKRRWLRRASGETQTPFGADVQPQGRLFMMAFRAKGLVQRFLPRFLAKRTVLGKENAVIR